MYIKEINSTIKYSLDEDADDDDWITISFPCNIENTDLAGGYLKILFKSNITITASTQYFKVKYLGGDTEYATTGYVQFGSEELNPDGSRPKITIDCASTPEYGGFIQNGNGIDSGYGFVNIFNLEIEGVNNTVLDVEAGWFGRADFAKNGFNCSIVNCKATGHINEGSGGIVGARAASDSGYMYIIGCSSSGDIDSFGGGIVGQDCCNAGGDIVISKCWSTGPIGSFGGGIAGYRAGINSDSVVIHSCYSTGNIGLEAGGIAGKECALECYEFKIYNSYSTGSILSNTAGGIIGQGLLNGKIDIINCYTIGNIAGSLNAGGICGEVDGEFSGELFINNCYVAGSNDDDVGYILGTIGDVNGIPFPEHGVLENNYSEAEDEMSGWNKENAITVLLGVPSPVVGSSWVERVPDEPFLLRHIGYSPYNLQNINVDGSAVSLSSRDTRFPVGAPPEKDMEIDTHDDELDPGESQEELFPDLGPFTDENIVQGDKALDDRTLASYWDDFGDDIFDDWGYFFLYDVGTQKYYFPIFSPINREDGALFTQTFNTFGRTFTITHGWVDMGIFKIDITVDDDLPFIFGGYGDMGSDGDEQSDALIAEYTIRGVTKTLYYNSDADEGNVDEVLYSYFIPKTRSENESRPYVVHYDGDEMSMYTQPLTAGVTIYYSKSNDVKDWIINEIKLDAGDPENAKIPIVGTTHFLPAIVEERTYTILQINNSLPSVYNTITIDADTGIVESVAGTVSGRYKLYIYHDGSYNITELDLYIGEAPPCFTPGTLVLTTAGYLPVEKLSDKISVITDSGDIRQIVCVYKSVVPIGSKTLPVIVPMGCLGHKLPAVDFTISQNHLIRYGVTGWILPRQHFKLAVMGDSVTSLTYYHVELPDYCRDNLVINGGVRVESFCRSQSNVAFYEERKRRMNFAAAKTQKINKRLRQIAKLNASTYN